MSQQDLIFSYFKRNPNRHIAHKEVVDWATAKWRKQTGEVFRDPDRAIRKLYSEGLLQKIAKGVYCYDPEAAKKQKLEDFTATQKRQILEKGEHKCAICGKSKKDGVELHIDHVQPMSKGGPSVLSNGQVLCGPCNYRKKNYSQTETGKKMFINLHRRAKTLGDKKLASFCENILRVYESHDINGHIDWKK